LILRRDKPESVDVVHDATELIVLEGFQPRGNRRFERGERFARDLDLAKRHPEFFGLLLPLSQLQDGTGSSSNTPLEPTTLDGKPSFGCIQQTPIGWVQI
jgi:hypothetical protein